MTDFCPKCGKELKEGEDFCTKCGHKIIDEKVYKVSTTANKKSVLNISNHNFKIVGYILAVISIIITILIAMGLPVLVLDSAILLMISGIVGGLGVILCIWKDEHLMASICAFVGLIMCIVSAYLGSIIPCIFFLITAIFCLLGGELKIKNKKFWLVPIVIIVIPFIVIGISAAGTGSGDDISIGEVTHTLKTEYGYCSGDINFEITTEKSFDYLEAKITYYDGSGKVINTDSLAWNELNVEPGTYKVDAMYYEKEMPKKATIDIFSSSTDNEPIYTKNVTFGA